jgi:hydroxyacylglutathione hydrolase
VLDVRRRHEWEEFHLPGATHVPLAELEACAGGLDADAGWAVVCASGYRSSIAASLLERAGLRDVVNATGGMDAWRRANAPPAPVATQRTS